MLILVNLLFNWNVPCIEQKYIMVQHNNKISTQGKLYKGLEADHGTINLMKYEWKEGEWKKIKKQ